MYVHVCACMCGRGVHVHTCGSHASARAEQEAGKAQRACMHEFLAEFPSCREAHSNLTNSVSIFELRQQLSNMIARAQESDAMLIAKGGREGTRSCRKCIFGSGLCVLPTKCLTERNLRTPKLDMDISKVRLSHTMQQKRQAHADRKKALKRIRP